MTGEPRKRRNPLAAGLLAIALTGPGLACGWGKPATDGDRSFPSEVRPTREAADSRQRRARNDRHKDEQFVPPTFRRGDVVVLPAVFPDGTTADIVYPPELRLAELGLQPAIAAGIQTHRNRYCCYRFVLLTKSGSEEFRRGTSPIAVYHGISGRVEVWHSRNNPDVPEHIFFRLGSWTGIVGDGNVGNYMGEKNRQVWARGLAGRETDGGFLVLEANPPMVLSPPGDGGMPELLFSERFVFVEVRLGPCAEPEGADVEVINGLPVQRYKSGGQFSANWCAPESQISVYVDAKDKEFVDLAARGLRVKNVVVNEDANLVGR